MKWGFVGLKNPKPFHCTTSSLLLLRESSHCASSHSASIVVAPPSHHCCTVEEAFPVPGVEDLGRSRGCCTRVVRVVVPLPPGNADSGENVARKDLHGAVKVAVEHDVVVAKVMANAEPRRIASERTCCGECKEEGDGGPEPLLLLASCCSNNGSTNLYYFLYIAVCTN